MRYDDAEGPRREKKEARCSLFTCSIHPLSFSFILYPVYSQSHLLSFPLVDSCVYDRRRPIPCRRTRSFNIASDNFQSPIIGNLYYDFGRNLLRCHERGRAAKFQLSQRASYYMESIIYRESWRD